MARLFVQVSQYFENTADVDKISKLRFVHVTRVYCLATSYFHSGSQLRFGSSSSTVQLPIHRSVQERTITLQNAVKILDACHLVDHNYEYSVLLLVRARPVTSEAK